MNYKKDVDIGNPSLVTYTNIDDLTRQKNNVILVTKLRDLIYYGFKT